jgi:hypothetical protein
MSDLVREFLGFGPKMSREEACAQESAEVHSCAVLLCKISNSLQE